MRQPSKPNRTATGHRFQLILTPAQYDALRVKAEQAGESMSTMIRRAIEQSTTEKPS